MGKYSFHIFWHEPDHVYFATCPEFPDLSAFGDTPEQAIAELKIALELAIETYQEEGWPLPEPKTQSAYSGQFRVRVPKSLHAQLASQATVEGTSLNTLVVRYLAEGIGAARAVAQVQEAVTRLVEGSRATFTPEAPSATELSASQPPQIEVHNVGALQNLPKVLEYSGITRRNVH